MKRERERERYGLLKALKIFERFENRLVDEEEEEEEEVISAILIET